VSQNHGRQLIKKAVYGSKIRWNRPVSVNAEGRESDGVVFADSNDGIGGIGARFGNEERIAVMLEALSEIVKVFQVKIGCKDVDVLNLLERASAGIGARPCMVRLLQPCIHVHRNSGT
jgi:hypothetical protein